MKMTKRNLGIRRDIVKSLIIIIMLSKSALAGDLSAYLYLSQFKSPKDGTYVESYLNIIGNTVKFKKNIDGKYQSNIEILYLFKQQGKIKAFEKYTLNSPLVEDTLMMYPNFIDVQRIAIKDGIYNFELHIRDLNDTNNTYSYKNIVNVDMSQKHQFSDIELVKSYTETTEENILSKNGLDLVPYVSSFLPNNIDTLMFYSELYNNDKKEECLLLYYIETQNKERRLNEFTKHKKIIAKEVNPIFKTFNISDLPTGNYNLVLVLKNKENKTLCQKKFFFQRYNNKIESVVDTLRLETFSLSELAEIKNIDLMKDYIKSTIPILNQRELFKANNILKSNDINLLKNFFNDYWKSSSSNPEVDWRIYKQNVDMVNRSYNSQIKRGYETDRGRVYLKYGKPSNIISSTHEPASYPYEIWHYFEINGETDKRFIFYNPEIAGDDYTLLHSDVTGEKSNLYWQKDLTRRNSNKPYNFDTYSNDPQYGNRSQDMYRR